MLKKVKRLNNYIPISVAPLFTIDFYQKWFNCNRQCAGIEFEYSERVPQSQIRYSGPINSLHAYSRYLLSVMNRHDGSGAYEVSLPPCSIATERDAYICAQLHTLLIDFLGLPIPDTHRKSGRHIHITRRLQYETLRMLESMSERGLLEKFYTVTIPFTASYVMHIDGNYTFMLREYVQRYARLYEPFTSHHAAYSLSRRWETLELRWNELPPTSPMPFYYLFAHTLYGTVTDELDQVVSELYSNIIKSHSLLSVTVDDEYFDKAADIFKSLSLHYMADLIKRHHRAVVKSFSFGEDASAIMSTPITNDVYMREMVDNDIFTELKEDMRNMLTSDVPLYRFSSELADSIAMAITVTFRNTYYIAECYYCYKAALDFDADAELLIEFKTLMHKYEIHGTVIPIGDATTL